MNRSKLGRKRVPNWFGLQGLCYICAMVAVASPCGAQYMLTHEATNAIVQYDMHRWYQTEAVYATESTWVTVLANAKISVENNAPLFVWPKKWVVASATRASVTKNFLVTASWGRYDQHLKIDLSPYTLSNGYVDAKFTWNIGHGVTPVEDDTKFHKNARDFDWPLALGSTNTLA